MNPILIGGLCLLIFTAGIAFGIVFGHQVVERDGARLDFLETMVRESWLVEIRHAGDNIGVESRRREWKWRPTLRAAIDAHRNGEAAVLESATVNEQAPERNELKRWVDEQYANALKQRP